MPIIAHLTQAFRSGQYTAPKTVLGFLGVIVLIMASFTLGVVVVLSGNDEMQWLIIPLLLAFFGGVVVLVITVLRLAQKDPTPLVLGEMSGGDYVEHQRLVLGDSTKGDRLEPRPLNPELPPPSASEAEGDDLQPELPRIEGGEE